MSGRTVTPLRDSRCLNDCRRMLAACLAAAAIVCTACGVRAQQQPTTVIDLQRYIELAVQLSDQVRDIDDDLVARQLDIDMAQLSFETRVTPLANFNVGAAADTRSVGLEARRRNEFGTEVGVGVESSQFASNTFVVVNPYTTRAYIRVSQGLLRNWGRRYNRMGLTVAELQREKELLGAERRRQDLLLDAIQRYHAALLAELLVERSAQALQRADSHVVSAQARHGAGLTCRVGQSDGAKRAQGPATRSGKGTRANARPAGAGRRGPLSATVADRSLDAVDPGGLAERHIEFAIRVADAGGGPADHRFADLPRQARSER
jgi:hypothetical protein